MRIEISNRNTFDEVFLKYHKSLCFFAFKYLKSNEDAEEVVQSVFLKIYEKHLKLDTYDEIRAFLYKSVYNACLNFIRSRERQLNRETFYFSQVTQEAEPHINDILRAELIGILNQELTHIPKIQADIIRMSYFEELSNEEIAKVLNLSIQTIKNYKNMGLKHIRSKFPKESLFYGFVGVLINFL
jgi:RNA polymerase sigma-70 factor (family 1)